MFLVAAFCVNKHGKGGKAYARTVWRLFLGRLSHAQAVQDVLQVSGLDGMSID